MMPAVTNPLQKASQLVGQGGDLKLLRLDLLLLTQD
jgi:hypothetical protein